MEYRVVRSGRKSLCLSVEKNGEILVRAPLSLSDRRIGEFVLKHERWILSRLERRRGAGVLSLDDGETLTLFGEPYRIETGSPKLAEGKIFLPEGGRGEALLKLLKPLCKARMTKITEGIASAYGFVYSGVRISRARGRWGSCSKKGTLSFTCFLAFVPAELIYYVVVHELCHTRRFNHGKGFWREVEGVLPDWRERRRALRTKEDCLGYLR